MASSNAGPISGRELIRVIQGGQTVWLNRTEFASLIALPSNPPAIRPYNVPTTFLGTEVFEAIQDGSRITMSAADMATFLGASGPVGISPSPNKITTLTGNERIVGRQDAWRVAFNIDDYLSLRTAGAVSLAAPAALSARWTPSFNVLRTPSGYYYSDLDTSTLVPASPTRTIYVNFQTGNDANTGLSTGQAYKTLLKALQQTVDGSSTVIYIDATAWTIMRGNNGSGLAGSTASFQGWNNSLPLGDVYIINRSAFRVLITSVASTTALTWNLVSGTMYKASTTATNAGCVVDADFEITPVDPSGRPIPNVRNPYRTYVKVADSATCGSTPGSWYLDTGANEVYVNRWDGSVPNTRVLVCNRINNGRAGNGADNQITYIENLDFVGGASCFKADTGSSTRPITFIDRNCTFSGSDFSTTSNLIPLLGPVTNYSWRAAEYGGWADNRNGHSNSADGTNSPSPYIFRDQCVSFGAGITGSSGGGQDNTFTIHDGTTAISVNCLDYGSRGIPVAGGTNYSMHWMLGGTIGPATDNTITLLASGQTNGIVWIDGTRLYATNGYQVTTGVATSFAYYRNIPKPTSSEVSAATILPY